MRHAEGAESVAALLPGCRALIPRPDQYNRVVQPEPRASRLISPITTCLGLLLLLSLFCFLLLARAKRKAAASEGGRTIVFHRFARLFASFAESTSVKLLPNRRRQSAAP